jgi:3-phenylpropionate/cinnamic acid dioxygenase small subunit
MTAMTLDELLARESIRQTMANYTMAGDRLRVDDFVAVFTEDAILESEGVPESDLFRYEGREAMRAWFTRWKRPAGEAMPTHQATFVRHHLATSQIEITGVDSARARTYWMAYTDIGADHCGYYLDTYRKVQDHWLIAHRKIRLDWRSPHSLFTTAISHSRG